jgi:TonB family protein
MRIPLTPPPIYATPLVGRARDALAVGHVDSAITFTDLALDPAARATEGDRVYALIVRGLARRSAGHDSLAAADIAAGVALYRTLVRRGVDLAPALRRLADSASGRGRVTSGLGTPTALGASDRIVLVSQPPVRYPPEMRTLRVDGTVIVEATVDTTGRVDPASVRVIRSPNSGLDAEARRVVTGAVYRPIIRAGRRVRATIRQPVTFVLY